MDNHKKIQEKHEIIAFYLLKEFFGEKFVNFTQKDRPDFWNKKDSIGLEITELKQLVKKWDLSISFHIALM